MKLKRLSISALAIPALLALMGAADGSWLKRVPAGDHAKPNPLPDPKVAAEAGQHLYADYCAKCHGDHGQGRGSRPAVISSRIAGTTDGDLAWLLRNGNSWKGMPSWSSLPDAQRWQLAAYLRSLNVPPVQPQDQSQQQGEVK